MAKLFFILSLVICYVAAAKPKRERVDLLKISRACSKELNLPRDDASKLLRGILERKDETAQCFVKCFYIETKIMDAAGEFDISRLKKVIPKTVLPKDKIDSLVESCKEETGDTLCGKAFNTYDCFVRLAYPEEESKGTTTNTKKLEVKPMALALYRL